MKVLVAHNRYRSGAPSGENKVVDAEITLLRENDVDVYPLIVESDDIRNRVDLARAAWGPIHSRAGTRAFEELLERAQPDVVHLHNVNPLLSPSVIKSAGARGVPVVQTVHNYRHTCANGLHFRDGSACEDCLGTKFRTPAARHGCFQGSKARTLPVIAGQVLHSDTWREGVDRFLALTDFMAELLVSEGFPRAKVVVRPSWVPDHGVQPWGAGEVLYIGRLDEAKGLRLLMDAWSIAHSRTRMTLHIVGDGPMSADVREFAQMTDRVRFSGGLDGTAVLRALEDSAFLVVPSLWFEGYPLVVAEAFAAGRPVLTCSGGAVETIVRDAGWICAPTTQGLADTLISLDDQDIRSAGLRARARYDRENSPDAALVSLLRVYGEVSHA